MIRKFESKTFMPVRSLLGIFLAGLFPRRGSFDPGEVTNGEYLKVCSGHAPAGSRILEPRPLPEGQGERTRRLVNFHEAAAYCRFVGKRLPTVDEWKSTCEGGKLKKRGDIWEWTSTDVDMGGQTYKALCGPSNTCDCSHRYLPEWKNEVKGFRCVQDSTPVTWLPGLSPEEVLL